MAFTSLPRSSRSRGRSLLASLALVVLSGCAVRDAACSIKQQAEADAASDPAAEATSTAPVATGSFKIVFLGDALTAGLGLRSEDAYPVLVKAKFASEGYVNVDTDNAGVTGQTTASGLQVLNSVLDVDAKILVVALGSNDALRGITLAQTRENLAMIIATANLRGVAVVLVGMDPPMDLGQDYQLGFRTLYIELSREFKDSVTFMPTLLEGVAGNPELNQEDGIRPNANGAKVIAQNMFDKLRVMVDAMGGG